MTASSMIAKMKTYAALFAWGILLPLLLSCARPAAQLTVEPEQDQARPEMYVIGPNDVLEVLVWKNEALSRIVTVRPDGNFSLPLIGDVEAAGLTPVQLREQITEKVGDYYKDAPDVSVIVREAKNSLVYILGEVREPGSYPLGYGTTLLQAITDAGGFTPFAATNKISVIRNGNGNADIMKIRYKDIVSGKRPDFNISLKPGDVIVIP